METIIERMGNVKLVATVVLGIIVLTLILPAYIRGRRTQPDKRRMRRKIKAEITEMESDSYGKREGEIWVKYTFTVDDRTYTGYGRYSKVEYDLFRKITVFYDPENPSKNCTSFDRAQRGTAGPVLWFCVILGMLALIYIFVE